MKTRGDVGSPCPIPLLVLNHSHISFISGNHNQPAAYGSGSPDPGGYILPRVANCGVVCGDGSCWHENSTVLKAIYSKHPRLVTIPACWWGLRGQTMRLD